MKIPVVMSWSGGKDSAFALHQLLRGDDYEVVSLMTSVSEEFRRISHHGVREELLDEQAGRAYDEKLLIELPAGIDPCGEYGEFHSFVYDGPIFKRPVQISVGEIVVHDGRYYADLLSEKAKPSEKCVAEQMPPV